MTKDATPYKSKSDRSVQIRSLLRNKVRIEEIIARGFPENEVRTIANSMKETPVKNEYEKKPKNPGRCKECGGLGEKHTFTKGICMACVCRERTNYERKGRWRV